MQDVEYCRFGAPWRKLTKFFINRPEAEAKTLCQGGHVHHVLRANWTRVAQAYPAGVDEPSDDLLQRDVLMWAGAQSAEAGG